jgi:hypothetical protein
MIQLVNNAKFFNIIIAVLIVSSVLHIKVLTIGGFLNIMLFDCIVFLYFVIGLPLILKERFDKWLSIFIFLIAFQLIHNLIYVDSVIYALKELIQSAELVVFFLILTCSFSNHNNMKIVLIYSFYILCAITLFIIINYYLEFFIGFFGRDGATITFHKYVKPSGMISIAFPILILSFYMISINSSKLYKLAIVLTTLSLIYITIMGNSRAMQLLLLIILLDYLFNTKRLALFLCILMGALVTSLIYQNDISDRFDKEYKEKIILTYDHIINDTPYQEKGYNSLTFFQSPSNKQRIHYLKLSYKTLQNNFLLGIGSKQVQLANVHGNALVFFNSYGFIFFIIFCYLFLNLFWESRSNMRFFPSPIKTMQHYYLLYALTLFLVVSAGNFPMMPLIIAAAMIKSSTRQLNNKDTTLVI